MRAQRRVRRFDSPVREFHVSRDARDRYRFDESLFGLRGNVVFTNFAAARRFAQSMNAQRDLAADPGSAVRAGDISAMGLVDEILHYVIQLYQRDRNPDAVPAALAALADTVAPRVLEQTLLEFAENLPTIQAYRGETSAADYLAGQTEDTPNREIVLEEMLLLWLANQNEGFSQLDELFNDAPLETRTAYDSVINGLDAWFKTQPGFGPDDEDLMTLLRKPSLEGGDNVAAQLRWIAENWGFAAERFGDRLVINLDVLTEEERALWMRFNATQGGADDQVLGGGATAVESAALHGFDFGGGAPDPEYERFSHDLDWMPRVVLLAKSTYVWLDQLSRTYRRPIWRLDQIPEEELDTIASRGFTGLWLIGLWERSRASKEIKQLRGNPEAVASAYSLMDYRIADDLGGEEAYRNLRDRAWSRGIRLASDMVPNHMGIDSRWVVEHPDWFMQRTEPPYPDYTYGGPNLSTDERVGIYIEDHYFDNSNAAVTFKRQDRWSGEERYVYHGNDGTSMPWNDTAQLDYLRAEVREAVIQTILAVARRFPIIRFDAAMTLAKRHIQRLWYPEPGTAGAIPSRAEYSMTKAEFDRAMPQEFWREVVDRVAAEAPDTLLLAEAFWLMEGYFVRTLGMHRVYNSAFMNMMRDEKNAEYRLVIKNTLEFDPQILKRYVNFMNNPDERTAVDQFGTGDKYFGVATVMATMPGLPMFGHGQVEGFAERYGMEYRRAYLDESVDAALVERHEREIFPLLHRRALFAEVDDFALYDFFAGDGAVNEDVFAFTNSSAGVRSLVVYHNRFAETSGWIRTAAVSGRALSAALGLGGGADHYLVMRDGRTDLLYLRSHAELSSQGLFLSLGAYQYHVFVEMYDVHDADGSYGRLAAYLGGRGVASLEDAMGELALAPLHAALRELRGGDAVREAAALIDVSEEQPLTEVTKADELSIARAIDGLMTAKRPDMSRGRWIYEWNVDRIWTDADLYALRLDREIEKSARAAPASSKAAPPAAGGGLNPQELLRDERFRRAIGVNEHKGALWFNRERFEHALDVLGLPRRADLARAAERAQYRLDKLEKELAAPPTWASTRPARTVPTKTIDKQKAETKPSPKKAIKADSTAPVKPPRRQASTDGD